MNTAQDCQDTPSTIRSTLQETWSSTGGDLSLVLWQQPTWAILLFFIYGDCATPILSMLCALQESLFNAMQDFQDSKRDRDDPTREWGRLQEAISLLSSGGNTLRRCSSYLRSLGLGNLNLNLEYVCYVSAAQDCQHPFKLDKDDPARDGVVNEVRPFPLGKLRANELQEDGKALCLRSDGGRAELVTWEDVKNTSRVADMRVSEREKPEQLSESRFPVKHAAFIYSPRSEIDIKVHRRCAYAHTIAVMANDSYIIEKFSDMTMENAMDFRSRKYWFGNGRCRVERGVFMHAGSDFWPPRQVAPLPASDLRPEAGLSTSRGTPGNSYCRDSVTMTVRWTTTELPISSLSSTTTTTTTTPFLPISSDHHTNQSIPIFCTKPKQTTTSSAELDRLPPTTNDTPTHPLLHPHLSA
ncbi:hypothetical protein EW146_g2794 [Bondarzewia mesenterica]|uniref:Uncharacterized protein n=1 Tax=Bondarzewia mesenterica TaxID=1095465 RepID=A0A4S4M1G7_9AGAM|nr:hypothetical protein EW146_g2794 [Bondarzewia mesenterica]